MDKKLDKINSIINKHGLPHKVKRFNKLHGKILHSLSYFMNTGSHREIEYLNFYAQAYDKHTSVIDTSENRIQLPSKQVINLRKPPLLTWNNNILTIKWFLYLNPNDGTWKETLTKYVKKTKNLIAKELKKQPSKLILDFTDHHGGNMWASILSMKEIYGETTLLAFGKEKVLKKSKNWINLINGKDKEGEFLTKKLKFQKPIEVLVSDGTASSGELAAVTFIGRENVIVKGTSAGWMSINEGYKINKDYELNLTAYLITTVDGKFHKKEIIS
jgi:hypothetical protein